MNNIFNLKSYFKFLSRNKAYTIIDIFGLSISLMFVILIGIYNEQERSIDKFNTKADRIYAFAMDMQGETVTGGHWGLQSKLKDRYPEIESSCAVCLSNIELTNQLGEKIKTLYMLTDSTFYQIFDFQLIRGDRNTALDAPDKAVISEKLAKQLFGNTDPIGKPIQYNDSTTLKVSAIMAPMEHTCLQSYSKKKSAEMIVSFDLVKYVNPSQAKEDKMMNNANGTDIYLLSRKGTDISKKTDDIDKYLKECFWIYQLPDREVHTKLVRFSELYFSGSYSSNGHHTIGDKKIVNILFAVGLAILLFALMNYVNLTVAQAGFRAKEMATRRLLGSSRMHIIMRLIIESTVLCTISCALGLALAFVFAPYASTLLDTKLSIAEAITPVNCTIILAIVLLLGFLAGILPAMVISAAKPIDVVRGTFRRKTKMVFSKFFITFQNAITIIMIAASLTMVLQINHLIKAPLGYDTENLIEVDYTDPSKVDAFINEVEKLPCVTMASKCKGTPYDGGNNNTARMEDKSISFQVLIGDKNYMKILGLGLERDNKLTGEEIVYINHQTLAELGLKDDATDFMFYNDKLSIGGIVKDFNLRSIEDVQHPVILRIVKELKYPWNILIKVTGNPTEAYNKVKEVYKNVFNAECDLDHPFLDQQIQHTYEQQIRLSKIVSLFAFIAIVISLLGLLAMSTYFIQQRSREIAVRKVFGSSSREVLTKLIRTFMMYVGFAFIIAIPVIYYFMNDWLSEYNYRIDLSWWIYVVAGMFCLVISFCTVFIQSYHAANSNPVESLKNN